MQSLLLRQRLLVPLAVVFSVYVLVLLANAYRSQEQLRSAAEARLLADNQRIAAVLSDFLAEQQNFVLNLAEGHEIETFLINKALGMSMRYGLNANLYAIEASFRRKLAQKMVLGIPAYQRILYFDEQGTPLADTATGLPPARPSLNSMTGPRLVIDGEHGQIIASAPVDYRGTPGGAIMTVANVGLLSRFLSMSTVDLGFRQFLIAENGRELATSGTPLLGGVPASGLAKLPPNTLTPLATLPHMSFGSVFRSFDLVLRVPIAGTHLSLMTVLPESVAYGHITSRYFLYFTSAVPFIILLVVLWIDRMWRRTLKLQADVLESNRNRAELKDQNNALMVEIARREALERELRESEERYRTYVENAPEGIFVADRNGRLIDVNPSASTLVGYPRDELIGLSITDLSPPGLSGEHTHVLQGIQRSGHRELEITLRRKDGTDVVANLRGIALPGDIVMGFCVDITERKRAEEQIHNLAYFDPLTGLPNRRLLLDRLHKAMAGSSRDKQFCALLMLDLDNFKNLNDTQGHDIGDRLLIEVAHRLTASVRQEDTVSRLGGDEYVVVVERLGIDESAAALLAETMAKQVHHALGLPYVLNEGRPAHHSSASVGVAMFRGIESSVDVLIKQADVALYQAKNAGRNTIRFFNPDMQAAIDARAMMETALRRAIRQNELRLYYQPQVDWHGHVIGAEALLRWLPLSAELISPASFIPLAEETGLIIPIGLWVLEQACAQLQQWQADTRTQELVLSINVSSRQFHQPDFVEQVQAQIVHFGIDAKRLKLELTESVVLDRVDDVIVRMQSLKALGVGFSLDDFGTGYSSLSYLKRLPLDQIKIDQSFVRDITHDQNDAAIVRAILAMSQSLGLNVIAEGVETDEQREFLLRYGCENYQGYLFGKPEPIESFPSP